ncbi:sugar diacid recognition domain-containing protein [uncultured Clostridium sp.]|uniref:CdaR family transcriptional regulator n=1 Tax=uncultured Clostridium sp. TaxID=59620 RepID=UPI0025F4287C|nr:sugar diacid recognition domain-containing protein [uncultured Clostridium sp.]
MLTKHIAQKIVDKISTVLPYNINIMNKEGIIIGSTNKTRIGSMHYGAAEALTRKKEVQIYNEDEFVKPGLNMPILFKEEIEGVIGITGDPDEVAQFAKIIKVTSELLLSEQYSLKSALRKELQKEEFLYEWIYLKGAYSNEFILKGQSVNIDILKPKVVALIYHKDFRSSSAIKEVKKYLSKDDYYIKLSDDKIIVIFRESKNNKQKISALNDKFEQYNIKIAVSSYNENINKSFMEAMDTLNILDSVYKKQRILFYDSIRLINNSVMNLNYSEIENIKQKFYEQNGGKELLDTLLKYIEFNGEKNKVSELLHIHRNTLNYRLNNIEEITGLNFNNYIDLYQLILFFLCIRMENA